MTELKLPDLVLPEDIQTILKGGGFGEAAGTDASNPELALHLEQLAGNVKDLGVLEFNLQTNWLRNLRRKQTAGRVGEAGSRGEDDDVKMRSLSVEQKHGSSLFSE